MKKWLVMVWVAAAGALPAARAVTVGEAAPDFRAASTSGPEASLADYAGSWLVLYFYPKSFTPGCTAEACSLRDGFADIQALGARILGVSVDSIETQRKFKAEHRLPFELLADRDGAVARAYGVLRLGGFVSKRVTFLISPEGRIARIIEDVTTGDHDAQVAEALRALQTAP